MDLNNYAKQIHEANRKWWHDLNTGERLDRNKAEMRMLIISELSECLEGERKNLMDDKLPHRKMAEVEMADVVIRMLDYACGFGYSIRYIPIESSTLSIPKNKAEALLDLTEAVCELDSPQASWSEFVIPQIIWGCEAYCLTHGYDLWGAVEEKLKFNETRADHTNEARKQANGKKF